MLSSLLFVRYCYLFPHSFRNAARTSLGSVGVVDACDGQLLMPVISAWSYAGSRAIHCLI
jgi:hypothetical protein